MALGWLVIKGSIMRRVAAICQSPRNTISTAICTKMTRVWRRCSARIYSACRCELALRATASLECMPINVQVLPDCPAIGTKFRRVARGDWRALRVQSQRDFVRAAHLGGATAQHDDPV